jgi:hypothetical protein
MHPVACTYFTPALSQVAFNLTIPSMLLADMMHFSVKNFFTAALPCL